MQRRTFLASGTAATLATVGGCLGGGDPNPNVVLDEPDREFESSDVPFPAWGEQIPDVSLSAPLDGREMRLLDVGEPSLVTFFYSHCQTVCPQLISTVRDVQTHAANEGYAESVSFLPITFDPARDTADRLRTYAEQLNVDADAGNWHFLRPASEERATAVVTDEFGVAFEQTHPDDMEMYMFAHSSLTLLVNGDGYVERSYQSQSPDETAIIEDLRQVRMA